MPAPTDPPAEPADADVDLTPLFEPLALGPRTAPNRIVFGAHFTMFTEPGGTIGEPGYYGARLARYLGERAAGGAGAIIAGQAAVHPSTAYQMPNNAIAWDPACIPGLTEVAEAVHAGGAGTLALLQLSHNGGVVPGDFSKRAALAPSPIAQYNEPPVALTVDLIDEIVAGFAASAANASAAGFDGVEIHAAHGYLIHQFLSPKLNRRTDDYGGSFEARLRFGARVLEAVRDAVGGEVVVGIRLVGDEETRDGSGLGPDDCAGIAAAFAGAGLVDFVNVSVGQSGIGMVRPLYARKGLGVEATATVKAAIPDVPVFAVHRLVTPSEAAAVLARGAADAVCLVRALIADADWVVKARSGRSDEIRRCVGCNQGCYGNLLNGLPVTCVTDPRVGHEHDLAPLTPAAASRRVVVVGAGPAGLEAAWVAAARGHEVILLERADRPGGKIALAAALPGRGELADLATWRIGECARRGVDLRTGVDADADAIAALGPDAVIVATGAVASVIAGSKWHPAVIGAERPEVVDHERALAIALGRVEGSIGQRVVIVDMVGHVEGVGLAELLATAGHEVTLAMPMAQPMLLDPESLPSALGRACRAGVDWRPFSVVPVVGDDGTMVVDVLARRRETIAADTVVVRTHAVSDPTLAAELEARGIETHVIGDARSARLVDRAIADGYRVGATV